MKKALGIIISVLLFDQGLKFWIKTHLFLQESITVFPQWFYLHFVENNGMAYGLEFGGEIGKILLSSLRIIAIGGIAYYLYTIVRDKKHPLLIISISLILAGAAGNAIDSLFYGLVFSESNYFEMAQFLPAGGGYESFLHGKVVDMFYFPIFSGDWPNWIPVVGGTRFEFFSFVFNVADASITIGIIILIVFQKRFFGANAKHWSEDIENEEEVQ